MDMIIYENLKLNEHHILIIIKLPRHVNFYFSKYKQLYDFSQKMPEY